MGKTAFVFPGQGAQYVGMGKDFVDVFPVAKRIYEEASDYLKMDMYRLCSDGPKEELIKTENTQPAILTTSFAMLKVIEEVGIPCHMTAGLSLGEYTSLVKAEVLSFRDAVQLVKKRGKYMQEAVPVGVGTMAAILGLDRDTLQKCLVNCQEYGIVETANYNSPGQIVISGEVKAVERAVKEAMNFGAKKAVILPVSAPFHSSLLIPAGEKLRMDLEGYHFSDPEIPVVTNVKAKILKNKEEVVSSLVQQVSQSVLWEDSIVLMLNEGVETFVEIGPGKALTGFIKRIAKQLGKNVTTHQIEDVEGFNKVRSQYQ
ncbi:malonyl CoA-acyl carrier protein transacylase [Alkaliphilus metalliredigens QYMF]|uniref:Malonyl CoA-acyl carrier protein transacylase n=1 Tax=Alkaliphilus metalliredigens (strain QYMF) TaxID=293826 RepID=A6TRT9_ALKMQ|nr:ACP S-malonyltransferase [Alkaliphilus metalliredigens]ABR48907.1 malonyl CoA-acyl carrier protein transacylase [Alkaliphilus metalliredigens QYMF]